VTIFQDIQSQNCVFTSFLPIVTLIHNFSYVTGLNEEAPR